jgi:hypothetical protein
MHPIMPRARGAPGFPAGGHVAGERRPIVVEFPAGENAGSGADVDGARFHMRGNSASLLLAGRESDRHGACELPENPRRPAANLPRARDRGIPRATC